VIADPLQRVGRWLLPAALILLGVYLPATPRVARRDRLNIPHRGAEVLKPLPAQS
jgi:hypothetical protein